jgi:hypothetical protein
MSAQLASASAVFQFNEATVTLACGSPTELLAALASFGKAPSPAAANDAKTADKPADKPKAEAPKATPAPTSAPASAPAAASGSESAGDAPRPTYDDVKARVLALAKKDRALATEALAKFGVDHGNKLKLEQYADFIKAADEMLGVAA